MGYNYEQFQANKQAFVDNYNNTYNSSGPAAWQTTQYNTTAGPFKDYYANQGTDYMYNGKYRSANALENALIDVHRFGDAAMNWQAQIAGTLGGEKEKENWTFDPNKFKLDDWSGQQAGENFAQLRNFAVSLPGQMIGGIIQAPGQLLGEVVAGDPYTEYKRDMQDGHRRHGLTEGEPVKDAQGNYLIPEYTLDAGQRLGQAVNAGINIAGVFTGGAGRVAGSIGKAGFTRSLERNLIRTRADDLGRALTADEQRAIREGTRTAMRRANWSNIDLERAARNNVLNDEQALTRARNWQRKAENWERRSNGWLTRGYERATGEEVGRAGWVTQTALDSLEEGGEEFIQEYAEQGARYKEDVTPEQAVTSALWGMAGGAMASGPINIVNNVKSRRRAEQQNAAANVASSFNPPTVNHGLIIDLSNANTQHMSSDVREQIEKRQNQQFTKFSPGSSAKIVQIDNNIKPGECAVGDMVFQSAVARGGQALQDVANDHNMSTAVAIQIAEDPEQFRQDMLQAGNMDAILTPEMMGRGQNAWTTADALNWYEQHNGFNNYDMLITRSPASKSGGRHAIRRSKYVHGVSIAMHAGVFQKIGSDLDGDMDCIFYGDVNRWGRAQRVTDQMMWAETYTNNQDPTKSTYGREEGKSATDWFYYGIMPDFYNTDEGRNIIDTHFREVLSIFDQCHIDDQGNLIVDANGNIVPNANSGMSFSDYYINQFNECMHEEDDYWDSDYRNWRLSVLFTNLIRNTNIAIQQGAYQQNSYNPTNDPNQTPTNPSNGEVVWSDLMMKFNSSDAEVIGKMAAYHENAWRQSLKQELQAFRDARDVTPLSPDFVGPKNFASDMISPEDIASTISTRGTIDGTEIAYNFEALGLLAYSLNKKGGTVIFRQSGLLYYDSKSFPDSFWSSLNQFRDFLPQNETMLKTFVRANFHMYASGLQPKSAMEGKIDAMILSEALKRANIDNNNKINTQEKMDALINAFCEVLAEFNAEYNSIMRSQGGKFVERNTSIEPYSEEFYASFKRVFEYVPITSVFEDNLLNENITGYNVGGLWDHYVSGMNDLNAISTNEFIIDFFVKARRSYRSMGLSLENAFKNTLDEFNKECDIALVVQRAHDDPNHNFGDDIHTVVNFVYFINDILGYDIAIRANILDENGMLTAYGLRLAQDSKDWVRFKRDLIALSIYTQLNPYIEEYFADNTTANRREQIVRYFNEDIAAINPLHAMIVDEILNQGTHVLFDVLTDMDQDYHAVQAYFDLAYSTADIGFNLFTDALMSEKTDFDYSGVSNRVRKAKTHLSNAVKLLPRHCQHQVDEIFSTDRKNTGSGAYQSCVLSFLQRQAQTNRFALDPQIFADSVLESMNLPHESVEKAVETDITTGKGVALKHQENGGSVSYQEEHFAWHTGIIPLEQARTNPAIYLALWANPKLELVVEDAKTGRINRHYSLRSIFEAAGIHGEFTGPDGFPSFEQCQAYFIADPTKISMFSEFSANIYEGTAVRAAGKSALDSFNEYEEATIGLNRDAKDLDQQFITLVYDVQRWLSNQVQYETYLIGCCSDLIERQASNYEIAERVKKVHQNTITQLALDVLKSYQDFDGGTKYSSEYKTWRRDVNRQITSTPGYVEGLFDEVMMLTTKDVGSYRNAVVRSRYENMEHALFRRVASLQEQGIVIPTLIGEFDQSFDPQIQEDIGNRNTAQIERIIHHHEIYTDLIDYIYDTRLRHENERNNAVEFADTFAENITNQILAANPDAQIDAADLQANIQALANTVQRESNDAMRDIRTAMIIEPDNLAMYQQNRAALIHDLNIVYQQLGEQMPSGRELNDMLNKALKNKKNFDEFCENLLWRNLEAKINYINKMTTLDLNANNARAVEQCVKFFDRALEYSVDSDSIISEIGNHLPSGDLSSLITYAENKYKSNFGFEHGTKNGLWVPRFSSKVVQFMCSRNQSANSFGGGMNDVSTNGLEVRNHVGYGFLPQFDNQCSYPTSQVYYYDLNERQYVTRNLTPRTLMDFIIENPHMRYEKIIVPGEHTLFDPSQSNSRNAQWHTVTIDEAIRTYGWDTAVDPAILDQEIYWFNPLWNPHGLSRENSHEMHVRATNQHYRQLSDILSRIDAASMEDLVLKLKKNMGKRNRIVNKIKYNLLRRHSIHCWNDWGFASNSEDINAYRNFLAEVRKNYAIMINEEFTNGSMSGIGCGMQQAELLACNLTPGLILHGSYGQTLYIDAYDIFCKQQFEGDLLARIQALGPIADVEACTITPAYQSFAIARNVRAHVDENSTADEYHRLARESLRFNGLDQDTLPICDITNHMAPYGFHYEFDRPTSAEQTAYQEYLDRQDPSMGASTSKVRKDKPKEDKKHEFKPGRSLDYYGKKGKAFKAKAEQTVASMQLVVERTAGEIDDSISHIMRIWEPEPDERNRVRLSENNSIELTSYNDWKGNATIRDQFEKSNLSECRENSGYSTSIDELAQSGFKHTESAGLVLTDSAKARNEAIEWSRRTGNDIIIPEESLRGIHENILEQWQRFGVIKTIYSSQSIVGPFSGRFYRLKPMNRRYLPAQSSDKSRVASEVPFQRDRLRSYMPDVGNIWNIADGWGVMFEQGTELGYNEGDVFRIDMHSILKGHDDVNLRVANPDEINRLYEDLNSQNWSDEAWERSHIVFDAYTIHGRDVDSFHRSTRRMLEELYNSGNSIKTQDTGAGKPLCIITDGNGHFAPVYNPANSKNRYDFCRVYNQYFDGKHLYLSWHSTDTFGDAVGTDGQPMVMHAKASIGGDLIAFKGTIGLLSDNVRGVEYMNPTIGAQGFEAFSNGDWGADLTMAVSSDTEEGRAVGQDKRMLIATLYNLDRAAHGSHMFQLKDSAPIESMEAKDYELRPFIANQIRANRVRIAQGQDPIGWTEDDLLRFLQGDDNVAWKVVSGELVIREEEDVNDVLKEFLLQQLRDHKPWLYYITDIGYDQRDTIDMNKLTDEEKADFILRKKPKFFNMMNPEYIESLFEMSPHELALFFYGKSKFKLVGNNHIISSLTARGAQTVDEYHSDPSKPQCLVDPQGNTWITIQTEGGEGVSNFMPVRWIYTSPIADWGSDLAVGDRGSVAMQNSAMNSYERADIPGYRHGREPDDNELWKLVNYSDYAMGNMQNLLAAYREDAVRIRHDDDYVNPRSTERNREINQDLRRSRYGGFREYRHQNAVTHQEKTLSYRRRILEEDGKTTIHTKEDIDRYNTTISNLRNAFQWDNMPIWIIDTIIKMQDGFTYSKNGNNDITLNAWCKAANQVMENIRNNSFHFPVLPPNGHLSNEGRAALPIFTNDMISLLVQHAGIYRNTTVQQFQDYMYDQLEHAMCIMESELQGDDRIKLVNYLDFIEYVHRVNHREFDNTRYIMNGLYETDYMHAIDEYIQLGLGGLFSDFDPETAQFMHETVERNREKQRRYRAWADRTDLSSTMNDPNSPTGASLINVTHEQDAAAKVLNDLTRWVQALAVMDPYLAISNTGDRVVKQTVFTTLLNAARNENPVRRVLSPYDYIDRAHAFTDEELEQIVSQPGFLEFYIEVRRSGFTGDLPALLAAVSENGIGIQQYMEQKKEERKKHPFMRITDKIFEISAGGNIGLKQQAKIFLQRYVMFAEEQGHNYLFQEVNDTGETYLKSMIRGDGAVRWFAGQLGAYGDTLGLQVTMNALQSAYSGDLAQRHIGAACLESITRRMPAGKFITATMISKFPNFGFNITDRTLNWILPMSSIYYIVTENIAMTEFGDTINAQDLQRHKNLLEAVKCDILHLGFTATAMVLLAISGAIEPPDDDRYMCNIEEWLVLGHRVREEWWIQDILGPILPVVTFARSCQLGKPMFSLIVDGTIGACYNNPFMRAGDIFQLFTDEEGSIFAQYERAKEEYKDAPGGGPDDLLDYMRENASVNLWKWSAQLFTPAFVRELGRMGDEEHSYKTIYKRNPTGGVDMDETNTEKVSYHEAMIRKMTRSNPMLGLIFDMLPGNNSGTGYLEKEMPRTIYYDDAQLNSAAENDQKSALEILSIIQRYESSMDELMQTGFYLSKDKKAEVSQLIWDNYYQAKSDWNEFAGSESADFYTLGEGDFDLGRERYYQVKDTYQKMQQYWYQLYNNCIKYSYLSKPPQMYYRSKTTYDVDAAGEVYATGFDKATSFPIPFQSAPGTLNDPQGTAGYEENFNALSAVTGKSMGQRALIPIDSDYEEWPDFEKWSEDGSGNSFSANYDNKSNDFNSYTNNNNKSNKSSLGGSRGGYGGGYGSVGKRRRGGGGGGSRSGSPSKSNTPSLNTPIIGNSNPSRIMNTDRIQRPNDISYLRPNFETKGSREAYKRSDI